MEERGVQISCLSSSLQTILDLMEKSVFFAQSAVLRVKHSGVSRHFIVFPRAQLFN